MFKLLGILAAMIAPIGSRAESQHPVRMVAEPVQQGIRIQVIGSADANFEASFVLEVASEGNRSLHHGTVALEPGQPVTLSTVTVGVPAGRSWRASLKVEPRGRQAYEQVESSS
jgi:hypothetical protein